MSTQNLFTEEDAYNRQSLLDHQLLYNIRPLVIVGAGGVGFNLAILAALSGVPEIVIIDHDEVTATGMSRMMLKESDLSRPKVEVLAELIHTYRPTYVCNVLPINTMFSAAVMDEIVDIYGPISTLGAVAIAVDNTTAANEVLEFCKKRRIRYVRVGTEQNFVSVNSNIKNLVDVDPEHDGYRVVPTWIGPSMLAAVFALYNLMYGSSLDFSRPIGIDVLRDIFLAESEVSDEDQSSGDGEASSSENSDG